MVIFVNKKKNFLIWNLKKKSWTLTLPNIGAAVSHPLSSEDIWKSHVADGKTKDSIVIPRAVFK